MTDKILMSRCAQINNKRAPFQRIPVSADTTSTHTTVHCNPTTDSVDRAFTKKQVLNPHSKQTALIAIVYYYLCL